QEKAFGYILKRTPKGGFKLLTLAYEGADGLRLPGGTLHADEDPLNGMFREVEEESGLKHSDLELIRPLGTIDYYKPTGDANVHRHDYLLLASSNVPEQWEHTVQGEDKDAGRVY